MHIEDMNLAYYYMEAFLSNKDKSHVFIPPGLETIICRVTYFYPLEYQSFIYSKLLAQFLSIKKKGLLMN